MCLQKYNNSDVEDNDNNDIEDETHLLFKSTLYADFLQTFFQTVTTILEIVQFQLNKLKFNHIKKYDNSQSQLI